MPPSKGKNKHPSASHASLSRLPIFRKHRRREKRRPPIHCRRRRRSSSSSSGVPGARSSRRRWMLFWHRRRSGPRDGSRGRRLGRLWLSEASMVGAGIRPGCLVSVSLISSSSDQLDAFPLVKLFEECNRFFDLDLDNDLLYGEAGKNFMVSTVFPLREVPKNGIKLSWDLACVLGHPLVDRLLFISPLCTLQAPKRSDDIHILRVMKCLDQRVGITVVVATNRPDKTDPALLRPGRFDRVLDVQPSNEADRADIFRIHTCSMPCRADMNLKELARLTEGYTGADIKLICREAAVAALDERFDTQEVAMRHFKSAISRTKPSDVKFFQELAKQFRRSLTSLRA